ncbi:hypothetical protein D3C76_1387100 [compost metagenome]|uniref:hypothetical protein n=1 Tax=Pseudomonas fluorescens TaxID=294 RepID=UPI000FB289E3|nr:hypothetical protein [Pseudomonas fluorescens]
MIPGDVIAATQLPADLFVSQAIDQKAHHTTFSFCYFHLLLRANSYRSTPAITKLKNRHNAPTVTFKLNSYDRKEKKRKEKKRKLKIYRHFVTICEAISYSNVGWSSREGAAWPA